MKKNLEILIAALILLNVFTLFKLNIIQNSLDNNYDDLRYTIENTRNQVSNFTSNINSLIEKQASIIDSYLVTFGEKLNADLTVPVKLSVIPKEYTEGTNVSLLVNDKKIVMERDGTTFSGSVDINIFEAFKPIILIEQDGVQKTESIDEYYDLQQKYILNINGGYNGPESYRSGKYIFNGNIDLQVVSQQENFIEDVKIIYDVNGITVKEQNAEVSKNDYPDGFSNFVNIDINELIDLKSNDKLTIYAVIKDNFGLNYKYVFKYIELDSNGDPQRRTAEWTFGTIVEISDKDNNVLYIPDYLKNKY
jgi:hypothetical protein